LHDRVFITKRGTPTYEAKDMALQPIKYKEWPFDNMVITTAHEQNEYFAVVFKALEELDKNFKGKLNHLGFGMVNLKSGKMSSREGNIITGIGLIEQGIEAVRKIIDDKENLSEKEKVEISEKVGIAAIKYSLLKGNPLQDTTFDFEESISFEGNSGPYLQYTYARAQSILREASSDQQSAISDQQRFNKEEMALLRTFYKFPEVVSDAAKNLAPNLICSYLFDLAQKFNLFYKKHQVLKAKSDEQETRLALTAATAQVLKNGLYLLGIEVLEKM
jgi:arginyl-tRNA synthetase